MKKTDIVSFAFGNFFRRKARSALTVLGVIIGTAAVVIMLSIGFGMQKGYEDQINSWGNVREIYVYENYGWDSVTGEEISTEGKNYLDDIGFEQVKALDHVEAATPTLSAYYNLIKDNSQIADMTFQGISAADMEDFGYEILYGRALNESDIGTYNFVMSYNIPFYFRGFKEEYNWKEIAEGEELPFNPVDEAISYKATWDWNYGNGPVDTSKPKKLTPEMKCVGIIAQKKGGDYDTTIYMDVKGLLDLRNKLDKNQQDYYNFDSETGISYATTEVIIGGSGISGSDGQNSDGRESIYSQFTVLADSKDHVQQLEKDIRALGFQTSSSMQYLTQMQEQTKFLRTILGAIGVVAFFVAALSITNTMIMSIYERTREIGIMKVMGCKLSDIRGMFLIEAGIIGVVGGLLGVGLSYGVSAAVNFLASKGGMGVLGIDSTSSAISVIPFWLNFAAIALATAVGVFSGLYPAIRATRLSALEAIKNE